MATTITTVMTSAIQPYVNDSAAIRKLGAPVYVRIPTLGGTNDILVKGADIGNDSEEDPEHSTIILTMAMIARAIGKQLSLD